MHRAEKVAPAHGYQPADPESSLKPLAPDIGNRFWQPFLAPSNPSEGLCGEFHGNSSIATPPLRDRAMLSQFLGHGESGRLRCKENKMSVG